MIVIKSRYTPQSQSGSGITFTLQPESGFGIIFTLQPQSASGIGDLFKKVINKALTKALGIQSEILS